MMAPQVVPFGEWSTVREPTTSLPMLAAMDTESTDGESSLLSLSSPGLDSAPTCFGFVTPCSISAKHVMKKSPSSGGATISVSPQIHKTIASINSTNIVASVVKPRPPSTVTTAGGAPVTSADWPDEKPSLSSSTAEDNIESGFYFESDHLAFRGNSDYQLMLRTVAVLESQRTRAIHDLDRLIESKGRASDDPIVFVDKLQRRVDMGLPSPQTVSEVPGVDWEYYTSSCDPAQFKQPKHITRHLKRHVDEGASKSIDLSTSSGYGSRPTTPVMSPLSTYHSQPFPPSATVTGATAITTSGGKQALVVRGRLTKDMHKSRTFNQLWTVDEQQRLEDLLVSHPPEDVEMRRWEKVANALGNRTATQVQSRVQKYFLKLAKSGLPVPGRIPYMPAHLKKKHKHQHQRHHKFLFPPSTFMASHEAPVYMADDDDTYSYTGSSGDYSDGNAGSQEEVSDDEGIPPELRDTEEYQELLRLKRLRRRKQCEVHSSVQHVGYKCDRCDCEPIIGVRWHCADCPKETSVDFCDNCADFVFETKLHKSNHTLDSVKKAETSQPHLDTDYTRFMPDDYNYLDPNYMPAS